MEWRSQLKSEQQPGNMANENNNEEKWENNNEREENSANYTRERDASIHEVDDVAFDFDSIDDEGFVSANEDLESNFSESQNFGGVDVTSSTEEEKYNWVSFSKQDDEEMANKRKNSKEERDQIMTEKVNVDNKSSQSVHVIDLETGAVTEIGATPSSSDADSDSPPHRKKKIWENLPVATPIFDAEVVTWNFDRPEYKPRFGLGFQDEAEKNKKEEKPREPIFTDKDRANIFRLIGKVIGIILALPLYFIYWLFTLGWVSPLLCIINVVFAKPIGLVIDCMIYCISTFTWFFYHWVLIPLYKYTLVYPARAICKFMLVSTKMFLVGVDWMINSFIAAVDYLISTRCCQCLIKTVSLASQWIYYHIVIPPIKFVMSIPSLVVAYLLRPVFKHIIRPFWQGILSCVLFMWSALCSIAQFAKNSILLPCYWVVRATVMWIYKDIVLRVYQGVILSLKWVYRSILKPFWGGFVAGISCMYKHILTPIGNGFMKIWGFLVSCVLAFWGGFVSGLSCVYNHILKPIGNGFMKIWGFLVSCVLFVYKSILTPIGKAVSSFFKTLYNYTIVPVKKPFYWLHHL